MTSIQMLDKVSKMTPQSKFYFQTFLGKVFGGLCAIVGVFTLTLPIPIVVNSFAGFYKNRLWRNEVAQKKRLRLENRKNKRKSKTEEDEELILSPESRQALIKVNETNDEII